MFTTACAAEVAWNRAGKALTNRACTKNTATGLLLDFLCVYLNRYAVFSNNHWNLKLICDPDMAAQ